jgi:hypothetical protein
MRLCAVVSYACKKYASVKLISIVAVPAESVIPHKPGKKLLVRGSLTENTTVKINRSVVELTGYITVASSDRMHPYLKIGNDVTYTGRCGCLVTNYFCNPDAKYVDEINYLNSDVLISTLSKKHNYVLYGRTLVDRYFNFMITTSEFYIKSSKVGKYCVLPVGRFVEMRLPQWRCYSV